MPQNFNDALDDPLAFDGQEGFFRQVSGARANLLEQTDCETLKNLHPERMGVTRARRGFHHWATVTGSGPLQGGAFFNGASEYLVVGRDGAFYAKGDQSLPVADLADEVIVTEDDDVAIVDESGNFLGTGIEVPVTGLSDTKIDETVSTEYEALVDEDGNALIGETGDVLVSETTTTFLGDKTAQWYFAQVGTRLFASNGISDQNTVQFLDDLSLFQDSQGAAPTGLKYLVSQGYRLFGVKEPDIVWVSGFLPDALTDDGLFTAGQSFQCGTGDADSITGLYSWVDFNLVVFKENSIFMVNTNPAVYQGTGSTVTAIANFGIRQVSFDLGCVSHRTVAQVGNDLWFLSRDGVRSLRRVLETGATEVNDPMTDPVRDLVHRINWEEAGTAAATFWNGLYILAVPIDGNGTNNAMLVYNTKVPGWLHWTGPEAQVLIPAFFSERPAGLMVLDRVRNSVRLLRDLVPQEEVTSDDHLDLETESFDNVYWSNEGGFVALVVPDGENGEDWVGSRVRVDQLRAALQYEVASTFYANVTSLVGSYLITDYPAGGLATSNGFGDFKFVSLPDWELKTRAFSFGELLNPKTPDYVELEFASGSNAVVDINAVLDGGSDLEIATSVDTSGSGVTRKRYNLRNSTISPHSPAREIQFKLTPAASLTSAQEQTSRTPELRTIRAGAFVEEIETLT